MPNRIYICHSCEESFEIYQHIKDDILTECNCGGKLYQDLSGILGSVMGTAKTVGQLADQNAKKLGYAKVEELKRKAKDDVKELARNKAKVMSEKTGVKHVAPCDVQKPKLPNGKEFTPLSKKDTNKLFSSTNPKETKAKVDKYIKDGTL